MQIGQLAAIDMVRYYENQGILPRPQRQPSGYRRYGEDAVARLRFIRRAKGLGFTRLQALLAACPGHGALERCPILAALSEEPA